MYSPTQPEEPVRFNQQVQITRIVTAGLGAFVASFFAACSLMGGAPGLKHAGDYTVQAPAEWSRLSKKDSDHAYSLRSGSIVTVVSSCDHRSQASLEVLSNQLLIGSRKRKVEERKAEKIGKHDGLWTVARVVVDSVPIHLGYFVTKLSDGGEACVLDFSLMGKDTLASGDLQEFRKFIASLEYGKD